MFKLLFKSITLTTTAIRFGVDVPAIVRTLVKADGVTSSTGNDRNEAGSGTVTVELRISLNRRGNETRLIIDSNLAPMRVDQSVIDLIAKAHLLFGKLTERPDISIADISKSFGVDRADVGRILPLAFLAPTIVEAILQGKQLQSLSPRNLARMHLPVLWADQIVTIQ
jgi:site-specific DNA recombinase